MLGHFNFQDFVSAFLVLFAIIDMPGSIPVILNLRRKGKIVKASKTAGLSLAINLPSCWLLLSFLSVGDLKLPVSSPAYRLSQIKLKRH